LVQFHTAGADAAAESAMTLFNSTAKRGSEEPSDSKRVAFDIGRDIFSTKAVSLTVQTRFTIALKMYPVFESRKAAKKYCVPGVLKGCAKLK
jgi:hypothetical protein